MAHALTFTAVPHVQEAFQRAVNEGVAKYSIPRLESEEKQ